MPNAGSRQGVTFERGRNCQGKPRYGHHNEREEPETLEDRDIRHVYIRPRTPHLNGKVERSHRVDDQEFYQLLDRDGMTDDIHLYNAKLKEWEDYYNSHRPHGA